MNFSLHYILSSSRFYNKQTQLGAFIILFLASSLSVFAQEGWSSGGCGNAPEPLLIMVDACNGSGGDSTEPDSEYFLFQTGDTNFDVNGSGVSVSVECPEGTVNAEVTSFSSSPSIVTALNAAVGPCPEGDVFVDAMAPPVNGDIPANAIVWAYTTTFPDISVYGPGYFSSLCGAYPVYVIFGDHPGGFPLLKNFGAATGCGAIRYIDLTFGSCTYEIDYDITNMVDSGGESAQEDGAYITLGSGGNINYGNDGSCIPLVEFCTPPEPPAITNPNITICTGQSIPAFICTNCDANTNWYDSEFGAVPIATGDSYVPSATDNMIWVENVADCASDRTEVSITVSDPPTLNASLSSGPYCVGDNVTLNATSDDDPDTVYEIITTDPLGDEIFGASIPLNSPGNYLVSIQVTNTITTCALSTVLPFSANDPLPVSLTDPNTTICSTDAIIDLTPFEDAAITGSWSGTGVSGSNFDPSLGLTGANVLTFTPDPGQCATAADINYTIDDASQVVLTSPASSFCSEDGILDLTAYEESGITGAWSGSTAISGTDFDLDLGTDGPNILTFTPDPGQCKTDNTITITIDPQSTVNLGIPSGTFCELDGIIDLTIYEDALVTGSWSGTGVTGTSFDPSLGSSGSNTIDFIPDSGQCVSNGSINIVVDPEITISVTNPASPFCSSDPSFDLYDFIDQSSGGTWSGSPAISGSTFDPSLASSGPISLDFSPDATLCASPVSVNLTINDNSPVVLTSPTQDYCESDVLLDLSIFEDGLTTGSWTGTGITTSPNFDPSSGSIGPNTLTFTPDPGQCTAANSIDVNLIQEIIPALTNPVSSYCSDEAIIDLSIFEDPLYSGNWTGSAAISGSDFDPSLAVSGSNVITFNPDAGQCAASSDITISITNLSTLSLVGPLNPVCELDGSIDLTIYEDPLISGNWSGTGVSGTDYDPSLGSIGSNIVTFNPDAGQCATSADITIDITAMAILSLTNPTADFCSTDGLVDLSAFEDLTISGSWTGGPEVNSNMFDPSLAADGPNTVTFVPDIGQCAQTDDIIIQVNSPSAITVTPLAGPICSDEPTIDLNSLISPVISGSWTGSPGISDDEFIPSSATSGLNNLIFTPDGGQCFLQATLDITVNSNNPVVLTTPTETFCQSDLAIDLGFYEDGITAGVWTGTGISFGSEFDPSIADIGSNTLTFTPDPGQCLSFSSINIVVSQANPISLGSPSNPYCFDSPVIDLAIFEDALVPGTWTGSAAISGSDFDPSLGIEGDNILTFTPNPGLCLLSQDLTITIGAQDIVSLTEVSIELCETDGDIDLTQYEGASSPGIWAGVNVIGTDFNPSGLTTTETLTFVTLGDCPATGSIDFIISTIADATISSPSSSLCNMVVAGQNPVSLDLSSLYSAGTTLGGTWSSDIPSNPITGTTLDVTGITEGDYNITYTIDSPFPCAQQSETVLISVQACSPDCLADPSFVPPSDLCSGIGTTFDFNSLLAGTTTPGGTWNLDPFETLDSGSILNTEGLSGNYSITYTIEDPTNVCPDAFETHDFVISQEPFADLIPVGNSFCNTEISLNLNTLLSPSSNTGGTWTCIEDPTLVSGSNFTLNGAIPGIYEIEYTVIATAPCVNNSTASEFIEIQEPITDAGPDDTTCGLIYEFANTVTSGAGEWTTTSTPSGNLGDATFDDPTDPLTTVTVTETGDYTLFWSVSGDACSLGSEIIITFTDSPVVDAGTDSQVCDLNSTLTATGGVGNWTFDSGPGTPTFDSSLSTTLLSVDQSGTYTFTYALSDLSCPAQDEVSIEFLAPFTATPNAICSADGSTYELTVELSGGQTPYFGPDGEMSGSTYSITLNNLEPFALVFDDNGNCQEIELSGTQDCSCAPVALDPVPTQTTYQYCQGEIIPEISVVDNGQQFFWFTENLAPITDAFASNVSSVNPIVDGTIYVLALSSGDCPSNYIPITINEITPPAAPVIDPDFNYCEGESIPILYTSALGNTVTWTNADGDNGTGTEFQPSPSGNGDFTYLLTETNTSNCTSAPTEVVISISSCACPYIENISPNSNVCSGTEVNLSAQVNDDNSTLDNVQWLDSDGNVVSTNTSYTFSATTSSCNVLVETFTFQIFCNTDLINPSSEESISISFYPTELDESLLNFDQGDCISAPTLNTTCGIYIITEDLVPLPSSGANSASWTITLNNGPGCLDAPVSFDYNCSSCFNVTNALDELEEVCNGDVPDFTVLETLVQVDDAANLGEFVWFENSGLNINLTSSFLDHSGLDMCEIETQILYLGAICTLNGDTIPAGSVSVEIYPSFSLDLLSPIEGDCAAPSLTSSCYDLTQNGDLPAEVLPTDSGTSSWTVIYPGGPNGDSCFEEQFTVGYSCGAACPIPILTQSAPSSICDGEDIELILTVSPSTAVLGVDYDLIWTIDNVDSGIGATLNPTFNPVSTDNCTSTDFSYSAVFTCLIPGGIPDSIIVAGTTTVYPAFDPSQVDVQDGICDGPTITVSCPNYAIIDTANWLEPIEAGNTGTVTFTVENECSSQIFNADYNCPPITCTPPSIPTGANIEICDGGIIPMWTASLVDGDELLWYDEDDVLVNTGDSWQPTVADEGTYTVVASNTSISNCLSDPLSISFIINDLEDSGFQYTETAYCQGDLAVIPESISTSGGIFSIDPTTIAIDPATGEFDATEIGLFTISYTTSGTCSASSTLSITISDCTSPCPTITSPIDVEVLLCGAETSDLSDLNPGIDDPDGNYAGINWYTDAALTDLIDPSTISPGDNCQTYLQTLYAGVICNLQAEPIAAGIANIQIFPIPTINQTDNCSLEVTDECGGTITIEYLQTDGSWSTTLPSGDNATWQAYVSDSPDLNSDGTPDCLANGTSTITNTPISLDAGQDIQICEGDPITLAASLSGSTSITWSGGLGTFDDPFGTNTNYLAQSGEIGSFYLYASSSNTCGDTSLDSLLVNIEPSYVLGISVSGATLVEPGQPIVISASGDPNSNYVWISGTNTLDCINCPQAVATPLETTTYTLSSSSGSCIEDASITITVLEDLSDTLVLPNAFSPNDDGQNDIFRASYRGQLETFNFKIFNRWGQQVYSTSIPEDGWDGTYKASNQDVGVYVYVIDYKFADGNDSVLKGNVTLIR